VLNWHYEEMNASLEYICLSKWKLRAPRLNPQSKFLKGVALNEVKDSIPPNCEPKKDFTQE
jgi:hypothetical protein